MEIIDFSEFEKEFGPKLAAITCQECGAVIMGGKRYVERYCLYAESDWTKCLCPSCTKNWLISKTQNELKNDYHQEEKLDGIINID